MEWWEAVKDLPLLSTWRLFIPLSWGGIQPLSFYRPLTGILFWINTNVLPFTPFTAHLINIFLHLINAILLFSFVERLTNNRKTALICALFWIGFPFHGEAIIWSAGRSIVLSTMFLLLYLHFFVAYLSSKRVLWFCMSIAALVFGLFSRETSIVFPLLAHVLFSTKHNLKYLRIHWITVFLYFIWHAFVVDRWSFFAPHQPLLFYIPSLVFLLGSTFILGLLTYKKFKKAFSVSVIKKMLIAIVITYSPYIFTFFQERYLYTASLFVVVFLVLLIGTVAKNLKQLHMWVLSIGLFFLFTLLHFYQNHRWEAAARINRNLVNSASKHIAANPKTQKWFLVNVPDQVKGVYVARTHLKTLIAYQMRSSVPELIMTPQTIDLKSSVVLLQKNKLLASSSGGFVLFNYTDVEASNVTSRHGFSVKEINKQNIEITFDPELDKNSRVLVYQNGSFTLLRNVGL